MTATTLAAVDTLTGAVGIAMLTCEAPCDTGMLSGVSTTAELLELR